MGGCKLDGSVESWSVDVVVVVTCMGVRLWRRLGGGGEWVDGLRRETRG